MHKNLLIIEDDVAFANAIKRRLTNKGFNCHIAHNGSDALLLCRSVLPDYILLDMKLEQENGLSLIKPLRAIVINSHIILLTGFASIASAVEAIKLGADDYLSKPVNTSTLISTLLKQSTVSASEIQEGQLAIGSEEVLSASRVEWEHIQQVLKVNNGNVSETARQLNMHRRTLQRKLQKKPQ